MIRRTYILAGLALVSVGCKSSAQAPGQQPTLTAAQQAEKATAAKQAEINMRTSQINRSNLSPQQKQALLSQIKSSAGK